MEFQFAIKFYSLIIKPNLKKNSVLWHFSLLQFTYLWNSSFCANPTEHKLNCKQYPKGNKPSLSWYCCAMSSCHFANCNHIITLRNSPLHFSHIQRDEYFHSSRKPLESYSIFPTFAKQESFTIASSPSLGV